MDLSQVLAQRPCAIIAHTLGVESAPLAVILAQGAKTTLQEAHVVTWNIAAAQADIGSKPSLLKRVTIWSYENVTEFSKITNTVIVFDNAEQCVGLIGLPVIQTLLKQGNVVMILFTICTPESILVKIRNALPGAYLTTAAFADHGQDIRFELHTSEMVPAQDLVYQLKRETETAVKPINPFVEVKALPGIKSIQIENLVYPTEIQALLEKKDAPIADVVVDRYGERLLDLAPKLRDLVITITLNREKRHVVFTRYVHHYGVDVVAALLKLFGFKVAVLHHGLTVKERNEVMIAFNADDGQVLVTSVMFGDIAPTNITHLHMLDGAFNNMTLLLNACYKYANYPPSAKGLPPTLIVDYYVCQRLGGADAGGAILYRAEMVKLSANIAYWTKVMTVARPIVITDDGRLTLPL